MRNIPNKEDYYKRSMPGAYIQELEKWAAEAEVELNNTNIVQGQQAEIIFKLSKEIKELKADLNELI